MTSAQGVAGRSKPRLDILMYHAVPPSQPDHRDWCYLPASRFASHMSTLKTLGFKVLPLAKAFRDLKAGELKGRAIAITFDDGYENNFSQAAPILERHSFPATVFLVSSTIDTKKSIWPSRVITAVHSTEKPSIEFLGTTFRLSSIDDRRRASGHIQELIKSQHGDDPQGAATQLEEACGTAVNPDFAGTEFEMASSEVLRRTAEKGLIEFGGHTATHPIISRLSDADLSAELRGSVDRVEEITQRQCETFAYPNGGPDDFDERAVTILRDRGVELAVTTTPGTNVTADAPYRLKRWGIGAQCTSTELAATLLGFPATGIKQAIKRVLLRG